MDKRPELNLNLDSETFRNYYYLKEELMKFCRDNGLPSSGNKKELTERIAHYLDTGEITKTETTNKTKILNDISLGTIIEENIVCDEKHRSFFKNIIGPSFTFNVKFQKWLKTNSGKTYKEAVDEYYRIKKDKNKTTIDSRFEYNTYIRDFFIENKDRTLNDAIKCWKYKKSLPGHNRYEQADLVILNSILPENRNCSD